MHCSISTPTPQLVLICCAFPSFPKNVRSSLLEKSPSAFQTVNLIQQSMHIHRFGPTPSNIALCMLQCIAASPHQRRSSCLSAVHVRLSEKYSSFAAREISIRFITFQLDTTKHAYPLRWANPFKYCTLHALMHGSISTPTLQLVPLSCEFPPFRKMF